MPKVCIDYSNTIFYKIYCKDTNVKELYVGHTTNFVQRKHCHKQTCNNEKSANHNSKVYKCIRDNGGWNNWKMEIIGFHECYDHYEARKIEHDFLESCNATLNSIDPLPKPKPRPVVIPKDKNEKHAWNCDTCGIICQTKKQFLTHQETNKHKNNTIQKKNTSKNTHNFLCNVCDFKCSKKSDYDRHLLTLKHQNRTILNKKSAKNAEFLCDCGKKYKARNSLWYHKKKCMIDHSDGNVIKLKPSTVEDLIKNNSDLQNQISLLSEQIMTMTALDKNVTTNNNTNHNHFNISVFLNEQCKNAVNFDDFIDNIRISHEDLENNARLGFVDGISKIIMDNLKQLTLTERPIHCTDVKRDTIYLKHENKWKKDKPEVKEILDKSIRSVSYKSIGSLIQWKQVHPDYADPDSDFSNLSLIIHKQSLPGFDRENNYQKIIHNLAKQNVIDKDQAM